MKELRARIQAISDDEQRVILASGNASGKDLTTHAWIHFSLRFRYLSTAKWSSSRRMHATMKEIGGAHLRLCGRSHPQLRAMYNDGQPSTERLAMRFVRSRRIEGFDCWRRGERILCSLFKSLGFRFDSFAQSSLSEIAPRLAWGILICKPIAQAI